MIREARPDELATVGDVRIAAYKAGGFLNDGYAPELRALGSRGDGTVLIAVSEEHGQAARTGPVADAGQIAGTIMLMHWPGGEVASGPEEAEIRALAVTPAAQKSGVGASLLRAALSCARLAGTRRVVLLTLSQMLTAHRLYERHGFLRLPERDWSPHPGIDLLAYGLELDGG
ncbi:MAG: GNAT family N-acetyltransferase [Streptosporangiaceae bacterium]